MTKNVKWTALTTTNQVENIKAESQTHPVIIFKHSTRCSISKTTLDRLERNWKQEDLTLVKPYFLDLLSYREISTRIAEIFDVEHESPQILIIHNGKSVYDKSHFEIEFTNIKNALKATSGLKN